MPKLPRVTSREALRAVRRDGWEVARTTGGHVILAHPSKPGTVTIPAHGAATIKLGTLRSILSQAGLSPDEFIALL